ncbi:GNAT family N-acetyltransferase [Streptomyces sp. NPDC002209]|uniref:GNAT family N-acetyltransferase n=1 Tax=Streptomyces sp. NPDC002209 TaxID=3364638 RepID=UPI0036C64EFF
MVFTVTAPGVITLRPYTPADAAAVLALVNADHLPGQPAATAEMLTEAIEGRSVVDAQWWAALELPATWVAVSGTDRLVGVISYARRPKDDTGQLLWLHSGEDAAVTETLISHAINAFAPRPIEAFQFASALSLGLEALPIAHRPATDAALRKAGFTAERLWRYMRTDLPAPDLPTLRHMRETASSEHTGARRLEARRLWHTIAEAEVQVSVHGIGVLWWIEVLPNQRGRGFGRRMLGSSLARLAELGAREAILYVDDDAPQGDPRDRTAANTLYETAGFIEVDRLYSYTLAATHTNPKT